MFKAKNFVGFAYSKMATSQQHISALQRFYSSVSLKTIDLSPLLPIKNANLTAIKYDYHKLLRLFSSIQQRILLVLKLQQHYTQ